MINVSTPALLVLLLLHPGIAQSHPGGLNSDGCHTDIKSGKYHCHGRRFDQKIPVRVVGVVDGDTIKVLLNGVEHSIRLHGIDAPESGQDYGQQATSAMKALTTGRETKVVLIEKDRYGRDVAMVFVDGANANELMIEQGAAWVYSKYCTQPFCPNWASKQATAKKQGKGLWQGTNPTPPWEWRHGNATVSGSSKPPRS